MDGCDAKTGRTKSEFRDICQKKLLQLSQNVIHHFSVYFLFFFHSESSSWHLNWTSAVYQLWKQEAFSDFFNSCFNKVDVSLKLTGINHLYTLRWSLHWFRQYQLMLAVPYSTPHAVKYWMKNKPLDGTNYSCSLSLQSQSIPTALVARITCWHGTILQTTEI